MEQICHDHGWVIYLAVGVWQTGEFILGRRKFLNAGSFPELIWLIIVIGIFMILPMHWKKPNGH